MTNGQNNRHQLDIEQSRLAYQTAEDTRLENFKAVISSAQFVLRALILLNGGAPLALLAFIGSVADKRVFKSVEPFNEPGGLFLLGLGFALLGSAGMYFTQSAFGESQNKYTFDTVHPYRHETPASEFWARCGTVWQVVSITLALFSMACFFGGLRGCADILAMAKLS